LCILLYIVTTICGEQNLSKSYVFPVL